MFFRSHSGFRVSTQVLFHWFYVVEFSEFSVPFPTWQFLPTCRVLQRVDLTLCGSLVRMNGSASDECHHLILSYGWYVDEKHPRGIPREGGGRRLCALRKLARLVCGDGARASALCLSGPLFSAHSSTFFDLDDVFILSRAFIWIFWVEIWFESASSCGASSSCHQAIQRLQGWSKRW